jgi:hypothetical protein
MKFYAQINFAGKITPLHDSDYDSFKKVPKNKIVEIDIKSKRNYQFHKKFFALLNMVFENQEVFTDFEYFRKELTIESGFYNEYVTFDGEIKREAKSISFAKMDEIEFSELYNKFSDTVIRLMGWDSEMINENLADFM